MPAETGPAAAKLHEALTALQQDRRDDARSAAEVALELFTNANDRTGAAAAHQVLAMLYVMAGQYDYATAHVDAALPLREATGDWEGVASLWQERVELCLRRGDVDGAKQAGLQQVAAMEKTNDREGLAHALHQVAQIVLQTGDDALAEELVQKGLWTMDSPGTERGRSALLLLYASVWMARGNPDRARLHASQALELARQAKNRAAEVDALQHIGTIHALQGEYPQARRLLEEALVGRELLKDPDGRAAVLRELANVEFALGAVDDAFEHLDYAVRSLREIRNWLGEITMLQMLQNAADERDRPITALQAARQLVDAAGRTGDKEAEAAAHFTLATRLAGGGDLDGAISHFEIARDAQLGLGLAHEAAVSSGMLGQVLVVHGRRDEGLALLRGSLGQLEALGSEAAATVKEILEELETQ